jgi:IclR family acetate operon transcriptional repressor
MANARRSSAPRGLPGRPSTRLVPAADRAARVLRALAADGSGARLSELSRALRLSKSTLFELLATLAHHGLVERDDESRVYRLGPALLELGSAALRRLDVAQIARPHLVRLRDAIGETAVLHVPAADGAIIVERAESTHDLKVVAPLGHRLPPLAGSVAKIFLAHRPQGEVAALLRQNPLPAFTPHAITDSDRYFEELARVRRRGFAIDDQEYLPGVRAVSAPVYDARGRVVAALSVVGSSARLTRDRLAGAAAAVSSAAAAISRRLGAPGASAARAPGASAARAPGASAARAPAARSAPGG